MPDEGEDWSVYLVRCADRTLYTGITVDVERRLAEHEAGRGAKYLRGRGPLALATRAVVGERALALRVEHRLKRLSRADKEALCTKPGLLDALVQEAREEWVDARGDEP